MEKLELVECRSASACNLVKEDSFAWRQDFDSLGIHSAGSGSSQDSDSKD